MPTTATHVPRVLAAGSAVLAAALVFWYLAYEPIPAILFAAALPGLAAGLALGGRTAPAAALGMFTVVSLVAAPGRDLLAYSIVRPGELGPFAFTIAVGLAAGAVTAASLATLQLRWSSAAALLTTGVLGAAALGSVLVALNPTPVLDTDTSLPRVAMLDYAFSPARLSAQRGTTLRLRLRNDGERRHRLGFEAESGRYIPSGREQVVELKVPDAPGTYRLICDVGDHVALGMTGELTVE